MIIFVIFLWFSFLFVTFKGEWNFTFFTDMDSGILRNDFLILSFSLSALALLYGSLRGCKVWQYGLWSFQTGGIKLERFLPKNQHIIQRKFLNFENWTNGEPQYLAKIRVFKVDYFILPSFLVPKLRSVVQNEWKKHPYIFFLLSVQK